MRLLQCPLCRMHLLKAEHSAASHWACRRSMQRQVLLWMWRGRRPVRQAHHCEPRLELALRRLRGLCGLRQLRSACCELSIARLRGSLPLLQCSFQRRCGRHLALQVLSPRRILAPWTHRPDQSPTVS